MFCHGRRAAPSLLTLVALLVCGAAPAVAAKISPTIPGDEYDIAADATCSLREAVQSANQNSNFGGCVGQDLPYNAMGFGTDTVSLGDGTFSLGVLPPGMTPNQSGNLNIPSGGDVTISHTGSAPTAIDAAEVDNVIQNDGTLKVTGLTIQNGLRIGAGGGIFNAGSVTLENVAMTDNETTAEGPGGAIESPGGGMSLTNVTISGNRAQGGGGGIHTSGMAGASIMNVTVSDNTADTNASGGGDGGGIWNTSSIAFNVKNTIVEGNIDGSPGAEAPDCSGTLTTFDHNLIGDATTPCNFTAAAGDQTGVVAGLATLADNGGPSLTQALPTGSLALDKVPPGSCDPLVSDQRGYPRPFPAGSDCDVGAYELFNCNGTALNGPGGFPGCTPPPPPPPAAATTAAAPAAASTAAPKKCRKGFKLKRGKCRRKKRPGR